MARVRRRDAGILDLRIVSMRIGQNFESLKERKENGLPQRERRVVEITETWEGGEGEAQRKV